MHFVRLDIARQADMPVGERLNEQDVVRQVSALAYWMHDQKPEGLATHDEKIIEHAIRYATRNRITADRFEFQMLYGVRRDLQDDLRRAGYRLRVYIPFGTQWYPYLMRRLAERPANIAFLLGNLVRESIPGR